MLEKIKEKIELETERILAKENLSVDEIKFLIEEKRKLEYEENRKETEAERQKALEVLMKPGFGGVPY